MTVADMIVLAARVRTMAGSPEVETAGSGAPDAIAIAGGRILAVGPRAEILPLAGEDTRVIDQPSATIVPGLVDAHSHPIYSLGIVRGLSLTGVHTRAELLDALERGRAAQDGEEWFFAWGLDPSAFEGRPVGNAELHAVLGADRPAYIKMFDAHSGIASAAALDRAGIIAPFANPDGSGAIGDAEGRLTGHLVEFPTMELVERILPPHTFEDRVRLLRGLLQDMAAAGITTAHVMDLKDADALALLDAIEADGELPVRLRISPWCEPTTTDAEVAELIGLQGRGGRRYRIEGVKLFIDGTVEGGTAWLSSPDAEGEGLASTWPEAEAYAARIRLFDEQGIPTATHAIGDRGIRFVAETLAALPAGGVPHRIEHIESAEDDVIALIGASGIVASMQPTHCTHHVRTGRRRRLVAAARRRASRPGLAHRGRAPQRRRARAGLGLAGRRVRSVGDHGRRADPALHRAPRTDAVGADQALTAVEALEGYTTHAHRAVGSDGGALVPGAAADLVVVDADPLTASPQELLGTRVLLTMVDGIPTHE